MSKEKIIILGHTGFVGQYLYRKLQDEEGLEIYGFSSKEVDMLNLGTHKKLEDVCDGKTTIIMAAAITRNKGDNISALSNNIKMALNLAKFLYSNKIKHLIYTSTIAIYGSSSKAPIIIETSPISPDSSYASAKVCGELIFRGVCEQRGITLTTLRMGKIYGQGDAVSPIYIFSQNIISGKPIEIYGDGSHRLYPVHQNDVFGVMKKVIIEEISGDYNVTPSFGITLTELARLLFKLIGKEVEIKFKPNVGPPVSLTFNTSKLKETFGDFPSISLEEGLKEYFAPITP